MRLWRSRSLPIDIYIAYTYIPTEYVKNSNGRFICNSKISEMKYIESFDVLNVKGVTFTFIASAITTEAII